MCFGRYMGTITGISDLDPVRWQNSHWRSVKVDLNYLFVFFVKLDISLHTFSISKEQFVVSPISS
jgi:hypothetical protein